MDHGDMDLPLITTASEDTIIMPSSTTPAVAPASDLASILSAILDLYVVDDDDDREVMRDASIRFCEGVLQYQSPGHRRRRAWVWPPEMVQRLVHEILAIHLFAWREDHEGGRSSPGGVSPGEHRDRGRDLGQREDHLDLEGSLRWEKILAALTR